MTVLRPIAPSHPCDRCGHPSKLHSIPIPSNMSSACLVHSAPIPLTQRGRNIKTKRCFCDGYFPA